MVAKNPLVSIVILNWNGLEDTKLCLEHVFKIDYDNYEVIVVDNGSSEKDKKYLSKLKNIIYVDNPVNRGFAGGQVDGYKKAKGEFILLLNNDAVIKADYIKQALPLFENKKVAAVGGRSYFWNEKEPIFNEKNRFYSYMEIDPISGETNLRTDDSSQDMEVNAVSGSATLIRSSVIKKLGYLWENFFAYYEETDLFARFKVAGYKILYSPNLKIWHKNGASSGTQTGSFFFYYHMYRNRYMFAYRNFSDNYFVLFKKAHADSYKKHLGTISNRTERRRLKHAYNKAMSYIKQHRTELDDARAKNKEKAFPSYNEQIVAEQASLSILVDATHFNDKELTNIYKKITGFIEPNIEYVVVVNSAINNKFKNTHNLTFVVDRRYFNTSPLNIAALVAKNRWLIIPNSISIAPKIYKSIVVSNYTSGHSVIEEKGILLAQKETVAKMGGFAGDSSESKEILIENIKNYAYVNNDLSTSSTPQISEKEKNIIVQKINLDNEITPKEDGFWQKLLEKHYRLYQLGNLTGWLLNPDIKLYLKAARTKNLILFSATLNRSKLATELKHIRNELFLATNTRNVSFAETLKINVEKFSKSQLYSFKNIPVFIICFNRVNDLKILVKKLEKAGVNKIVFIDNNSTYPPLLDYYKKSPYQILPLNRNAGHTAPWTESIIRTLIPYGYYIVTDPDVIPTTKCIKAKPIQHLLNVHQKYPEFTKVGLGLKIDNLPDHYKLKESVIAWEKQFWKTKLEDGVFEAPLDTTFALYRPASYKYTLNPSIRTGEPYLAEHRPWYINSDKKTDEDIYYQNMADTTVTSWNTDSLPDRYEAELKK